MTTQEQRYIRWKTTPLEGGLYALQITAQSHIIWQWFASNGVEVASNLWPNYDPRGDVLCVRGTHDYNNFEPISFTADKLAKVEQALTEYNFAHSEFAEEWEIVGWQPPKDGEQAFVGDKVCEHEQPFGPAPELMLVIRRKQPPGPTGEQCVGCLCLVYNDDGRKRVQHIERYDSLIGVRAPYMDCTWSWWSNAIPLTPDEVMEYYEKAKGAWGKK